MVAHIDRPLAYLDPFNLGEVHMESGRVHVVRAGAVDPQCADARIGVLALESPEHDIVGDLEPG